MKNLEFVYINAMVGFECDHSIDSRLIRAGDDLKCIPQANQSLHDCASLCCGEPLCKSFSYNAPWNLSNPYMGCKLGIPCCCLKSVTGTLGPNTYDMNITTGVISARTSKCNTDWDCSLNGVCQAGTCSCDTAWKGVKCEQLNLVAPQTLSPAYPPPALYANTTSWGGSVVKAENGKFHMFAAEVTSSQPSFPKHACRRSTTVFIHYADVGFTLRTDVGLMRYEYMVDKQRDSPRCC